MFSHFLPWFFPKIELSSSLTSNFTSSPNLPPTSIPLSFSTFSPTSQDEVRPAICSDVRPWPWPWPWPWPEAENLRPWPWPWPWRFRPWPWPWPWGFRPWPWPWPWGSRPWPWPWPWGPGLDRGLESLMFNCQSIILFRQCVIKFRSLFRSDGGYIALRLCFSLISINCRDVTFYRTA